MLKRIASRLDGRTGVIAIEASDPVPYVASQPDPRTFVVELRDVVTAGFADGFTADPRHPFAAVQVENAQAFDGSAVARVRLTLDPADAAARAQRAQRDLRRGRSRSTPAPSASGIISLRRSVSGDSRRARHQRGNATARDAAGTGAPGGHEQSRSRRTARRGSCSTCRT